MSAETVNPGSKIKTDWYQTETHVVVEVRLKSAEGKESLKTVIFLIQVFCTTVVNSSPCYPENVIRKAIFDILGVSVDFTPTSLSVAAKKSPMLNAGSEYRLVGFDKKPIQFENR